MAPELAHALTALDPAELGARIKAARVAAGLTQPELAGSDASVAYLSRIESGQRRPSAELLEIARRPARRHASTTSSSATAGRTPAASSCSSTTPSCPWPAARPPTRSQLARDVLAPAGLRGRARRARCGRATSRPPRSTPSATPPRSPAFQQLLADAAESAIRLKAATALCRIWREQGQLERAIACAQAAAGDVPAEALGSEEGIRLSVTLAAALFMAGRTEEAAELCDRAIAESERLSSPVARASAYWNASVIRSESGDLAEALPLAKRALHLLENTERVRDIGRLRTQLSAIMLRTDPPRLEDAQEQLRLADTELDWSEASPTDRPATTWCSAQALLMDGDTERRARARPGRARRQRRRPAAGQRRRADPARADRLERRRPRRRARDWYRRAIAVLTGVGADREAAPGLVRDRHPGRPRPAWSPSRADAFRRAAASTGLRGPAPGDQPAGRSSPRSPGRTPSTPAGRQPRSSRTPPRRPPLIRPARRPRAGCGIIDVACTAAVEGW